MIEIRKIKNIEEKQETIETARKDNHSILFPSHTIYKNNKIVGGWSLDNIPLVMVWSDSKSVNTKDSLYLQSSLDAIMHDRGHNFYMMACNSDSPYYKYMGKLGFNSSGWNTNLFIKKLTKEKG